MATTAEQLRSYRGPAILSFGFRPFFLLGAIWSAAAVAIWLPLLGGSIDLPIAYSPIEWHVHELLYGYLPAIVAGFLLTAVPNWTGRLPVLGRPLLGLLLVWIAGRAAMLVSARIGAPAAAVIDVLFLPVLASLIGREIVLGRSTHTSRCWCWSRSCWPATSPSTSRPCARAPSTATACASASVRRCCSSR